MTLMTGLVVQIHIFKSNFNYYVFEIWLKWTAKYTDNDKLKYTWMPFLLKWFYVCKLHIFNCKNDNLVHLKYTNLKCNIK